MPTTVEKTRYKLSPYIAIVVFYNNGSYYFSFTKSPKCRDLKNDKCYQNVRSISSPYGSF